MLKKIVIISLYLYTFIFFSQLLIDVFFGSLGTIVKFFLALFLWFIAFIFVRRKLPKKSIRLINKFTIIFIFSAFVVTIASIFRGIPFVVIFFNLFLSVAFYPLIHLFSYIRSEYLRFDRFLFFFLVFLIFLTDLIAMGIVLDSQGGLTSLPFFGDRLLNASESYSNSNQLDLVGAAILGGQKRGSFFIGGSTSIFPVISVGCLSNVLLFSIFSKKKSNPLLFIPTFLIIWIGAFFSLSRTPLLLTTIICIYGIISLSFDEKVISLKNQLKFSFIVIVTIFVFPLVKLIIFDYLNEGAISRFNLFFSPDNNANFLRYRAWEEGIKLFERPDAWLGYGIGTSGFGTRRFLDSLLWQYHYESSFFSAFSESGPFGLLILLLPYIAIIIFSLKTPNAGIFTVWSCLVVINLFSAPINGYAVVFPSFLILALCFSLRFYSKDFKKHFYCLDV